MTKSETKIFFWQNAETVEIFSQRKAPHVVLFQISSKVPSAPCGTTPVIVPLLVEAETERFFGSLYLVGVEDELICRRY